MSGNNELLTNPVSALVMDDTAFIKLEAAQKQVRDVENAIQKVTHISTALAANASAVNYEDRDNLLVEVTLWMTPHEAVNTVEDVRFKLDRMLREAEKELENL